MKEINVKGTARAAFGKKAAREIRKANAVPCNLYGEAKDENGAPVALPFTVTNDELRNLIDQTGKQKSITSTYGKLSGNILYPESFTRDTQL